MPSNSPGVRVLGRTFDLTVYPYADYVVTLDNTSSLQIYGWRSGILAGDYVQLREGRFRVTHVRYFPTPPSMFVANIVLAEDAQVVKPLPSQLRTLATKVIELVGNLALRWLYPKPKGKPQTT